MKRLNESTTAFLSGQSSIDVSEGDYRDAEGLWMCGKCNTRKQVRFDVCGKSFEVMCLCDCKAARIDEEERATRRKQRARQLMASPASAFSIGYKTDVTFPDGAAARHIERVRDYANHWEQMRDGGHGLALIGPVGTGKTAAAAALCNQVRASGASVLFTSVPRVESVLWDAKGHSRVRLPDSLSLFDLLVIDDLGCERMTDYMDEQAFSIVDARYRSGKPLVVTTNIPLKELKRKDALARSRIYDRVLERCQPVIFDGANWRERIAMERREQMLSIFDENEESSERSK